MSTFIAYFDQLEYLDDGNPQINERITQLAIDQIVDDASVSYELATEWLLLSKHSVNNFKTYRSELNCFFHFYYDVLPTPLHEIDRRKLEYYLDYCLKPPADAQVFSTSPCFKNDALHGRIPNPTWRPFLAKKDRGHPLPYKLSDKAANTKLAILSSFFNFLIDEEYVTRNPAAMILRRRQFQSKDHSLSSGEQSDEMKFFSVLQWSYVIAAAESLAESDPDTHERTLFLIKLMYLCYPRISEISHRPGFSPVWSLFRRDPDTGVWSFRVLKSKGGKSRSIMVSNDLLKDMVRYRRYLGLSDLPTANDSAPLFVRHKVASKGDMAGYINANLSVSRIYQICKMVFSKAAEIARTEENCADADQILVCTPHSIRHTGISHDLNLRGRPIKHVLADSGHESLATLSIYNHATRTERYESAKNKLSDELGYASQP